jgi:hypothetical protein
MEDKKYSELEEGVDYIDLGKRESNEIHKERTADLIKGLQEANEWKIMEGRATEPEKVKGLNYNGKVRLVIECTPELAEMIENDELEWPITGTIWHNGNPYDLYTILEEFFEDKEDLS